MAIAHDAETRFPATDITGLDTTTGDQTFTHTPVGTPAGVIVVVNCTGTVPVVDGVLYAGISMTPIAAATDTAEPGRVFVYALTGIPIPTGPATVTLQNCTATPKFVTCSTVTSATGITEIVGSNAKQTTTAANPTLSVVTTKESLLYGGMHGGGTAPSLYSPGSGYTTQFGGDYGALSAETQRSTSPVAAGTITYDLSYATSDDYCIAAVAIAENTTSKFGAFSAPFTFESSVSGDSSGPPTSFGEFSLSITFDKSVSGKVEAFGEIAFPIAFDRFVSAISSKKTDVAEFSLAPGETPFERTNHRIVIRARTTSGSTGVMRVALYEGSTNRSGDLSTSVLTNSLADYILEIPDAAAETIIDYSNLSVRIWGFDSAGNALTFEVADLYLSVPVAGTATHFGSLSLPVTFGESVSGRIETFGQIVSPFTFVESVSGVRTTLSQIDASFALNKEVIGRKTTFGQIEFPINLLFDVIAETQGVRYGQTSMSLVFDKNVEAIRETFGQVVSPYFFEGSTQSGRLETFGRSSLPIDFVVDVITGRIEAYSSLSLELLIDLETSGIIKPTYIILNQAKAIYLGSTEIQAVYIDSQEVWSK